MHLKDNQFDYVFCRNVLIYFKPHTTLRIIKNISQILVTDGYLFTGNCEMVRTSGQEVLQSCGEGSYKKNN